MAIAASAAVCAQQGDGGKSGLQKRIVSDLKSNTQFGGYIIGKASANDRELSTSNKSHTNFDIRLVRLYVGGKVLDFEYKLQAELNGNHSNSSVSKEKEPRIVDAWVEWQKYGFAKVKFGQFKRAFTFENPMHPWNIGFGSYSQVIDKLAGFNDRIGEHSSNGRDIGLQLQGDLLPVSKDRHNLLHYQVGVYNGQGINHSDENNAKDVIGGVYLYPCKQLAIGAFGWSGSYTKNGVTADRIRMSYGVKYEGDWTVRAEYVTSKGHKVGDYNAETGQWSGSTGADGWYAMVGAPVAKNCKVYAKWDVYRDAKDSDTQKSMYALSADYYFTKNLKVQANYSFTDDKSTKLDGTYNTFDVQLYVRF